jgi:hypothetical protein
MTEAPRRPLSDFADQRLVCATCGLAFVFPASQARRFAQRGWVVPRRCVACREHKRQYWRETEGT